MTARPYLGKLRDPYRSEVLGELTETRWPVTALLRIRWSYRGQTLDDDVRRSKVLLYVAIGVAVVGTALSLVRADLGLILSLTTPLGLLGSAVYEHRRDAFLDAPGTTPVRTALNILGGVGELPVSYLQRVEVRLREPCEDPFHASSDNSPEDRGHLEELLGLYQEWVSGQQLSANEAEIYRVLRSEPYAGNLADLVETARSLAI